MTTSFPGWPDRLRAVAQAQGRYLFLLALAGLFYYALDQGVSTLGEPLRTIVVPLVGVQLAALTVWASGPCVLGFLLSATLGATEAVRTAARGVASAASRTPPSSGLPEELDVGFNILDAAVYTTASSPRWATRALALAYPVLFTAFWVEGAVLLVSLFVYPARDLFPQIGYPLWQTISALTFRAFGAIMMLLPVPRLARYWNRRLASSS